MDDVGVEIDTPLNLTPKKDNSDSGTIELDAIQFQARKAKIKEADRIVRLLGGNEGDDKRNRIMAAITKVDAQIKRSPRVEPENERILDLVNYPQTERGIHVFSSPDGETITEDVVFFTRPDSEGNTKFLSGKNGEPTSVNAGLWDTRLDIKPRWALPSFSYKSIPITDGKGNIQGMLRVVQDGKTESK